MLFDDLAGTSLAVAETPARLAKIALISDCLGRMDPTEVPVAVAYLSGELPQGTIGVGWAALRRLPSPAQVATLGVLDVDEALGRIAQTGGPGSQALRRTAIDDLFARATEREQQFLIRLLMGELRQGALEGVMVEAVARATEVPATEVRRALMLAGDLREVATAAVAHGREGLARFRLTVLRPLQPMLAQTSGDLLEALGRISPAAVEWKLDGARIQVHRLGDEVRVFTRNLADVTNRVPEIVEGVRKLSVDAMVLDGEAIALREDGRPHSFQITMSRFGSRLQVGQLRATTPLSMFFFDCLHLDGEDLLDRPEDERFAALADRLPPSLLVTRMVTDDLGEASGFLDAVLKLGHEGVMVKALGAPYEAGRRGAGWVKVKRAHTLDLVVLAAEWGHGRRKGWLSNLHLGARDQSSDEFVMLGKTFKGMTDKMLTWQTERLLELEERREGITVFVRPELVVEVAFDGVQSSSRYPAGVALRFARVKGYRTDKTPADADTIKTVLAIHGRTGPPDLV
ncbi:MAG: ATP-dependent DNA ligase [Actinobacteria bacterium]|nr:ATP-dependent DNA ligase [Actinomycetota bacterium]